jgi:hypothetical protein
MAARAAIAFSLAALIWAASARAEDDPACAQYREPMAYNACLARHGPRATDIGRHPAQSRSGRAEWDGRAPARFHRWQGPQRVHGRMHMEFQVR